MKHETSDTGKDITTTGKNYVLASPLRNDISGGTLSGVKPYVFVFFLFFVLHIVFSFNIIANYFPTQDTLSFICNSTNYIDKPDMGLWFTEGLTRYFIFSPEWSENFCNYMRPVANFVYWGEYLVWGEHWGGYILFSYLINTLGILLVFVLSYNFFRLSFLTSLAASFVMFVTSFRLYVFYYPAYIFDAMAAVLVGIAFLLLLKKKYVWTTVFLTIALFTKELAVYGPFAAVLTILLMDYHEKGKISGRTLLQAGVMVLPVVIWYSARRLFMGGLSGNYGFTYMELPFTFSIHRWISFIVKEARTVFHWPTGWPVHTMLFGAGYEVSDIVTGRIFADFKYVYILAILNPIFTAWFLLDVILGLRKKGKTGYPYSSLLLLPWILGIYSLLMVTLDFLGIRYGYPFFMFVIPFSLFMVKNSTFLFRKALFVSYLLTISVVGMLTMIHHCQHSDLQVKFYQNARQVSTLIRDAYEEDPSRPIYLINDVSGIWGSYYLGEFAAKSRDVRFAVLNSVWILEDLMSEEPTGDYYVDIAQKDSTCSCVVKIPENKHFFFYGAAWWKRIVRTGTKTEDGIVCDRTDDIQYVIHTITDEARSYPFGKKLTINVTNENPVFIYYCFEHDTYEVYSAQGVNDGHHHMAQGILITP